MGLLGLVSLIMCVFNRPLIMDGMPGDSRKLDESKSEGLNTTARTGRNYGAFYRRSPRAGSQARRRRNARRSMVR